MVFTFGGEGIGRDGLEGSVSNFYSGGFVYDSEDASYARKVVLSRVFGGLKRRGALGLVGLAALVGVGGCTPLAESLNRELWEHAAKEAISKNINPNYPGYQSEGLLRLENGSKIFCIDSKTDPWVDENKNRIAEPEEIRIKDLFSYNESVGLIIWVAGKGARKGNYNVTIFITDSEGKIHAANSRIISPENGHFESYGLDFKKFQIEGNTTIEGIEQFYVGMRMDGVLVSDVGATFMIDFKNKNLRAQN